MKKLIGIVVIFVVAMVGWVLYLNHDTKTFIEKLPQPPAGEQPANTLPSTDSPVPEVLDKTNEARTTTAATNESDKSDAPNTPALQEDVDRQHAHDENNDWRTDNAPHNPLHKADPWRQTDPQPQEGHQTHFVQMSPDKKADFLRDSWLKMFGDIPEVHTASEYMRKVLKQERMTIDEVVAGLEASHQLFPKGGFKMRLEHYKSMKEMGIPILYPEDMK